MSIVRGTVISRTEVWDVATLSWISWDGSTTGGTGGAGDASAANQVIGNASLASIDTRLATQVVTGNIAGTTPVVMVFTHPSPSTVVFINDAGHAIASGMNIALQGSMDGVTYTSLWFEKVSTSSGGFSGSEITDDIASTAGFQDWGQYVVATGGMTHFRLNPYNNPGGETQAYRIVAYPFTLSRNAVYLAGANGGLVPTAGDNSLNTTLTTGTQPLAYGAGGELGGNTLRVSIADANAPIGSVIETAPTTDIASSGLNGRLQRIAQRLTSLIALLPTALGAGGGLKVDGSGTALPTSQGVLTQTAAQWLGGAAPIGTAISITTTGYSTVIAELVANAIFGGAVTFEGTVDGVTWTAVEGIKTGGLPVSVVTLLGGNGLYRINAIGLQAVRIRVSSAVSGTSENVSLQGSAAPTAYPAVSQGNTQISSANAWWVKSAQLPTALGATTTSGSVAVNIASDQIVPISASSLPLPTGAATATAQTDRTQKAQITDGTRDGTVKAASTLPLATDTAVVVTLRESLSTPVTGTVTTSPPANASTNVAQLAGTATSVNSGVKDAGTLRVVLATDQPALTNKLLVTPDSVALPANQSVNAAQFGGTNVATGTGASGAGIPRVTVANDSNVIVTPPTLTKGTQSATGFSTQELRDAGRNTRIFMLDAITVAPVAEALATVVQWYGNAAVAGTTTPAVVPAGKTLRLTGYKIQYQSLATVGYAVVRIRANTGGVAVLASPLVASFEAGTNSGATTTAVTGAVTMETGSFPEGLELPAGTGIGFSVAGYGPTGTLTLEGGVRFEVHGYEY